MVYLPTGANISVSDILTHSGFDVTEGKTKPNDPSFRKSLLCECKGEKVSLSIATMPDDPTYQAVLIVSRPKHGRRLAEVHELLVQHGALDNDQYESIRRKR